jgi:hypothetical protein
MSKSPSLRLICTPRTTYDAKLRKPSAFTEAFLSYALSSNPTNGALETYNLGSLEYNPTFEDWKTTDATGLLVKFSKAVIQEYGHTT